MTDDPAYKRSQLRLPHELHAAVVKAAENNGRSMNNEIVARLEASFAEDDPLDRSDLLSDLLTDHVFSTFEEDQQAALDAIDTTTVAGMVEWLDTVAQFNVREKEMEAMVAEAIRIHGESRKSPKSKKPQDPADAAPKPKKGK